ncbi:MAG: AAA family ATPase, partial [Anaerolineales bacterium]
TPPYLGASPPVPKEPLGDLQSEIRILMSRHPAHRAGYDALFSGEGMLKTVFKVVKAASTGRGLDRVFITGVSPIVLSDATSGYNVAENISLEPEFHETLRLRAYTVVALGFERLVWEAI